MNKTVALKVIKLPHFDEEFDLPFYATKGAAGADLRASFPEKKSRTIAPGERCLVPTGLSFAIPEGFEVQIRPRSGLSLKTPLMVVNSPGTIDADYRGEICIIVGNFGTEPFTIDHGLRVAQMVMAPVWIAEFQLESTLDQTDRGSGGFGSTGIK